MKIVSTAPLRISYFGGGTDVPSYYKKKEGRVINLAINLRTHVTLFTEEDMWNKQAFDLPYFANTSLFEAISSYYHMNSMHHRRIKSECDGFIGCGLGSSASASVALIGAFRKALGESFNRRAIAELAYEIESSLWYGGKQDQYASAMGGLNYFQFGDYVHLTPFQEDEAQRVAEYSLLFYVGGQRNSRTLQKKLQDLLADQERALDGLRDLVPIAQKEVEKGNMNEVGRLLHESWTLKKQSNKVSNKRIDSLYEKGLSYGALGGKLLGAGECGYMLFIVPPHHQKEFIQEMEKEGITWIDFSPDSQGLDVRIV